MAKRKQRGRPTPKKKKKEKKENPLVLLMQEHPSLSKEEAQQVVDSGLSLSEWHQEQERLREERRLANQARKVAFIRKQYPQFSEKQAQEILERGLSPQEYKRQLDEQLREQRSRERRQGGGRYDRRGPGGRGRAPGGRSPSRGSNRGPGGRGPAERKPQKKRPPSKKTLRQLELDKLVTENPEMNRAIAGQILSGHLTYEEYLARRDRIKDNNVRRPQTQVEQARKRIEARMQALEERVKAESHLGANGDSYLKRCVEGQEAMEFTRFHNNSFYGTLETIEPFRIIMKTERHPSTIVVKRHCTLLYPLSERDALHQQILVELDQKALHQYPPRSPEKRYHIPEDMLEAKGYVSLLLHDGLLLSGHIIWFDRFQMMLKLSGGGEVFVFRHAVHRASNEPLEEGANTMTLAEFNEDKPELPTPHPEALPPQEVIVPVDFDDYPVKDELYQRYLEVYTNDEPWKFPAIKVRREGDEYVLLDGYRRLTLALEKEIDAIPIAVS